MIPTRRRIAPHISTPPCQAVSHAPGVLYPSGMRPLFPTYNTTRRTDAMDAIHRARAALDTSSLDAAAAALDDLASAIDIRWVDRRDHQAAQRIHDELRDELQRLQSAAR